ncbi:MAG: SDR family oxidoreductase [Planctomycetes bacterium]|nr:SDR family oxidoreductase [Planctomycetota bacterium]
MDLELSGRTVLITGASGGIGRAIAAAFAAEGARVALHARRQAAALADWVARQTWRDRALVVQADVRAPAELDAAVDEVLERWHRLDACIVNAGVWVAEPVALVRLPEERVRTVVETNLLGAIWSARAFLRALARTGPRPDGGGAALVFIGSTAGRFGERGHVEYAASKAALRGVVLTLKNEIVEIDPRGRVNLVEPGWTVTEMTQGVLGDEAVVKRAASTMPLRRFASAHDIAAATLVLVSEVTARHVSGEFLTVAGGMEGRILWVADEIDAAALRGASGAPPASGRAPDEERAADHGPGSSCA